MKNLFLLILFCFVATASIAQDANSTLEKRSRDFFAAINSSEEKVWIKFIEENFSQTLIRKPMKKQVQVEEKGDATGSSGATSESEGTIEQKVQMFRQLHADFAKGKIISLKTEASKATMTVESADGLRGKFNLGFEKGTGLIEALGIEIVSEQN